MFRNTQRLSWWLAAAIAATALAVPATSAAYHPDNSEPAIEVQRQQPNYQDLRNPDTRDPASTARGGGVIETPPQSEISKSEPGFDWGDAAIGAGSVLGLVLIAISVMFAVVHHRNRSAEAKEGSAVTS